VQAFFGLVEHDGLRAVDDGVFEFGVELTDAEKRKPI
jgi:hypothetical protein